LFQRAGGWNIGTESLVDAAAPIVPTEFLMFMSLIVSLESFSPIIPSAFKDLAVVSVHISRNKAIGTLVPDLNSGP
jgi:hypothetical protein